MRKHEKPIQLSAPVLLTLDQAIQLVSGASAVHFTGKYGIIG